MKKVLTIALLLVTGFIYGEEIITINTGFVNTYLIKGEQSWILVDTGMHGSEKSISEAINSRGIKPEDISHIIITHGHSDHFGNLKYYKELTKAQVICHKSIEENLANGEEVKPIPRTLLAKVLQTLFKSKEIGKIKPEITIDDYYDLKSIGLKGSIIHTPGHSKGSITIVLDSGQILIGDQLRKKSDTYNLGLFYEDEKVAKESLKKISSYKIDKVYLSHGEIITKNDFINAVSN